LIPFFSIIIPTYNRPKELFGCLQSLTKLHYPRDRFEVIVVDDGSPTPLEKVVSPFLKEIAVTLVSQSNRGPGAARNSGADRAKGDIIAFTDDDCMPAREWLVRLATRFGTVTDHAIGGRTLNGLPNNVFSTASQVHVDYLYRYYNVNGNEARFFSSNNLAVPTSLFREMGGFDVSLVTGEDREFCDRWLHFGYRMIYDPEVIVYHAHALTLSGFWRQHFNYGRGAFRFHQVRDRRCQQRIRMEPLAFYLNLLRYPLSRAWSVQALWFAALMVVSQGANAAGFLWERVN